MTSALAQVDLEALTRLSAEELLDAAFCRFPGRAAIGTSLQKTGIVTIDMAVRRGLPVRVFFVDTLLNHDETYDLLEEVQRRYGLTIERHCPTPESLDLLHRSFGQNAHYFARDICCQVRKAAPLQEALETLDVWIAGLRRDQSSHRQDQTAKAQIIRTDAGRPVLKLNPLHDWTEAQIDEYARRHDLPYNRLYDYVSPYGERYRVIGCRCCHVPTLPEMDKRMGKFPWEQGKKECGIHANGSGI